ncbi:MAG TPA: class I SAM-dependent methyltransferase [Candidatus Tumulicola sp.]|nr:class I SAM-dependent methyltransferase [Candidatus Tumulicola sp.]
MRRHEIKNLEFWERTSADYQAKHASQLNDKAQCWGVWAIPESDLHVLGDVRDKDVLEFGCGAAQWSIFLAVAGARPTGLDFSQTQLDHARRLMRERGVEFPLLLASAEAVPLPDASFDIVFCDHGAMSFADPERTVPEAARLLRPGGLFAFNMTSPLMELCWDDEDDVVRERLMRTYFGMRGGEDDETIVFQRPYGEWIRLFRAAGLEVEALIELRPPENAQSTYRDYVDVDWARRWPAENIWKLRKPAL